MTRRVGVDPAGVRGKDVAAWQRLDSESPAVAVALRSAVIALCSSLAVDAAVVSLALVSAARVWLGLDEDDRAGVAYAARRAVRFARQDAARLAATDPDAGVAPVDLTDPDVRLRLDRWESRPDGCALVSGAEEMREAFNALLTRLDRVEEARGASPVVRILWGEIAAAWLAHSARDCERCEAGNGSRVSLDNIRAHVAGVPVGSAAWKRGKRSDGRVVSLVTDALAALAPRGTAAYAPRGWVWGDFFPMVYGVAWNAVQRGDSRDYKSEGVRWGGNRAQAAGVNLPALVSERERFVLDRSKALVSGPLARVPYVSALDSLGYPSGLGYGLPVTRFANRSPRVVSLVSDRVVTTDARPGPDTRVRVAVDSLGYGAHLGYAPRAGVAARDMSERERSVLVTVRESRPVPFAGEFGERVSSAPIGERDRRDDGQVRSFKPVVSPRKKAPANGPSVPANGMMTR